MKLRILILLAFGCSRMSFAQNVSLVNSSFEGAISQGQYGLMFNLPGWVDCGAVKFPMETPPDIHPNNFWRNDKTGEGIDMPPANGNTYLGMVVRKNNTYESVSQKLEQPLLGGQCYLFSVDMMRSQNYWSLVNRQSQPGTAKSNFTTPIVLRIWGSNSPCYTSGGGTPELLSESDPVTSSEWQTNIFNIRPTKDYQYITLEAFYKTPAWEAYLGHILLDNASDFMEMQCDDDEAVIAFYEQRESQVRESEEEIEEMLATNENAVPVRKNRVPPVAAVTSQPATPTPTRPDTKQKDTPSTTKPKTPKKVVSREKILKNLDKNTIKAGQKIKIEKLYFAADSANISTSSYVVLDELAEFLIENDNVQIEIGGHTNGVPSHAYSDSLSTERAKAVAKYLESKGVEGKNLTYKGYGKRQPIATNKSRRGKILNQRVEIKILKL